MKTPQEIFDAVWNYFIVENHPRAVKGMHCVYRGPLSNCAIGCQLPDELYDPAMEKQGIDSLMNQYTDLRDYFGVTNQRLLEVLQFAHDSDYSADRTYFSSRLLTIAKAHNLTLPSSPSPL